MKKEHIYRGGFYVAGLLILALGIILNTKSGLGVSPIISVAYSISTIWELNFGNTTFLLYTVFVLVEIVIHLMRKEKPAILLLDALQLPLSLIFTRFMNLFSAWIPTAKLA